MAAATAFKKPIRITDPTSDFLPDADFQTGKEIFRNYSIDPNDPIQERVRKTYLMMHTYQTVDFVKQRKACWTRFDKGRMTIMEALEKLNEVLDESDPDVDTPNIVHAYQTAERLRESYPDQDWLHLTGLIHDLGKIMAIYGEAQWAVVGETFPVGCAFSNDIVYSDTSFALNQDLHDKRYNTRLGMYKENCGIDNVLMSWSHDEYIYQVLMNHGTSLPDEALYIMRFHSFFPWYAYNAYMYLCNEKDIRMMPLVQQFAKFDLYSKADSTPDVESLKPYYKSLIDKYINPGPIAW